MSRLLGQAKKVQENCCAYELDAIGLTKTASGRGILPRPPVFPCKGTYEDFVSDLGLADTAL